MEAEHEVVLMAEVEHLAKPTITAILVGSMICTKITSWAQLEIIDGRMTLADGAATARMAEVDAGATVGCKIAI